MKANTKKLIIYFLSALALLLSSHLLNNNERFHPSLQSEAERLQGKLHQQETVLEDKLKELSVSYTTDFTKSNTEFSGLNYPQLFNEEGILFLIYEDDKLRYWSDNSVPVIDELTPRRNYDSALQKLSNGWYLSKTIRAGNKTFVGLLLLKNEYPFENKYLQNGFNKCFDTDEGVEISLTKGNGTPEIIPITIGTKNGTRLFSLVKSGKTPSLQVHDVLSILLFIAGLCFLLLSISGFLKFFPKARLVLFPLSVLFVRGVMLYFQYPQALYTLPLFDPAYFAFSALFPSLGDFLLNMLTIALLVFYITGEINSATDRDRDLKKTKPFLKIIYGSASLLIAICLHFPVSFLFKRLIVDSDIDFTINNLFSLSFFSYTGLFITWLMLSTWFLVLKKSVELIEQCTLKEKIISFFLAVLFFAGVAFISGNADLPGMGIIVLICGALLLIQKRGKNPLSVFSSAALLLGFSVYAACSFTNFQKEKVELKERFFAEKLAAKQDPIAEYIFPEVAEEIQNDRIIKNIITLLPLKQEELFSRFEQKFLNDYIQKYEVRINVFDTNDSLIASNNKLSRTIDFYKNIEYLSKTTAGKSLLYSYEADDEINYLGKIIFSGISRETKEKHTTVFIEFEEKISKNELGFPELLLDKNVDDEKSIDEYSFAVYRNGEIVSAAGNFSYSADEPSVQLHNEKYEFRTSGKWQHLFYKPNPDNLILLSKPQLTIFQKVTGVSFLFLLFSVFLLLTVAGFYFINHKKSETGNFRNRINISIISILTIFLLFIGLATIYYVSAEYRQKNMDAISEKIKSVLIELESKSVKDERFYDDTDLLGYTLNKFSKVFFTDINLYDKDGNLIVSTRPRLFDIGLISEKMNVEACFSMLVQKKTLFVHNENIGKLNYLSAYAPLTDNEGEIVAYLNLPYFAKQSGLQKEILTLLSALVNIYVLLIIIAVAIVLFISKRITEPFEVIGKNIQQVKLGKENKPIAWKSNDEIGRLVTEYNNMIRKLGESAETLAKSERESAWREMAKQVAHEIKNPLTPMKLSVQHLQRSYKEQSPGWDKNIERMTRTLIEQIDTLSHIASEFSNFAKMPKADNEKINIADTLVNVIQLFNETENCSIEFTPPVTDIYVFADREQLQRVFTNLIKNAIQSVPENRDGRIFITAENKINNVLIKITDNGSGISDEMKERIFTPNFTTKSTGMGLGLAMVKNIVEISGGSIGFETKPGEGTVFFVSLPVYVAN